MDKDTACTLANVRDILLDIVDAENNACGDMISCTVSSSDCVECLAKQIKKQYLELKNKKSIELPGEEELPLAISLSNNKIYHDTELQEAWNNGVKDCANFILNKLKEQK